MKKILSFIFAISYLILSTNKVDASGLSLGVYPPIIKIEAIPPASITTPIVIQNLSDDTVTLKILFKPFTASEKENGEIKYLENDFNPPYPLIFQKIQVFEEKSRIEELILSPQQEKKLALHVGIPKDEPLTAYYFSIVFLSKDKLMDQTNTNLSGVSGGIAANVLLSIGPKGKTEGSIEEFSAPFFFDKGPVLFKVRIKNTGKRVIAPSGEIMIKNMFGQTVGKVDLLPVNILAGTVRAIPDSLQSPEATTSQSIIYNLSSTISPTAVWPEIFLLGPYTATLRIALSEEGPLFV